MQGIKSMAQILLRIQDEEYKQIKQKAVDLGLTTSAYIRQILRESLRKTNPKEQKVDNLKKDIRALVPVLAEALGRTLNTSQESVEKLSPILLKIYDKERQV